MACLPHLVRIARSRNRQELPVERGRAFVSSGHGKRQPCEPAFFKSVSSDMQQQGTQAVAAGLPGNAKLGNVLDIPANIGAQNKAGQGTAARQENVGGRSRGSE